MKTRTMRPGPVCWRPRCEGLEARRLLSISDPSQAAAWLDPPPGTTADFTGDTFPQVDFLAVVGSRPTPDEVLRGSVTTLAVQFDRPLDAQTLGSDFVLMRVLDDGGLVPVNLAGSEALDPNDPSWIVLTLDHPLGAGHYRLFLSAASMPSGIDGAIYFNLDGTDLPLADFQVEQGGVTLSDAVDLGTLNGGTLAVPGQLDFTSNPQAVALYRVTLPATQSLWQLGLEISAQRIGSPLGSRLTLFDASGQPIKTATIGRKDAPNDPFLFADLVPGTYYIGVSAAANQPGQAGGYDPVRGVPGQAVSNQPGGAFVLNLSADSAEKRVQVRGFRLDRADPWNPTPTGFTMQFSGAILVGSAGIAAADGSDPTLQVVDQNGQSWPIAGVRFDETQSIVTYLFCAKLPAGLYTVRVPQSGGLSDLTGRAPVAPGLPEGVLATFRVAPIPDRPDPNDLGVLYPKSDPADGTRTLTIPPGESVTLRYVLATADTTRLGLSYLGSGLQVELLDSARPNAPSQGLDPGTPGGILNALIYRPAGVYYLRLTATGSDPVQVRVSLALQGTFYESLLQNGVGQGPALNLRLVAPTVDLTSTPFGASASPTPTSGPGAVFPIAAAAVVLNVTTPGPSQQTIITVPTPLPSAGSLFLTVESGLVGMPSSSAPGPLGVQHAEALAAISGPGAGQGTSNGTTTNPTPGSLEAWGVDEGAVEGTEPDAALAESSAAVSEPEAAESRERGPIALAENIRALAEELAHELDAGSNALAATTGAEPSPVETADPAVAVSIPHLIQAVSEPAGPFQLDEARVDPLTFGAMLALCALPLRDRLRRWLSRTRPGQVASRQPLPARPHRASASSRRQHQPA